jgi:hypothetical protein
MTNNTMTKEKQTNNTMTKRLRTHTTMVQRVVRDSETRFVGM